jgi:hypothetical protein
MYVCDDTIKKKFSPYGTCFVSHMHMQHGSEALMIFEGQFQVFQRFSGSKLTKHFAFQLSQKVLISDISGP